MSSKSHVNDDTRFDFEHLSQEIDYLIRPSNIFVSSWIFSIIFLLTVIRQPEALVTFGVGRHEDIKSFIVHREIICLNSPILRAAFNSSFVRLDSSL